MLGTQFTVYDNGNNPNKGVFDDKLRRELIAIIYVTGEKIISIFVEILDLELILKHLFTGYQHTRVQRASQNVCDHARHEFGPSKGRSQAPKCKKTFFSNGSFISKKAKNLTYFRLNRRTGRSSRNGKEKT